MAEAHSLSESLRFFTRWVQDPFLIGAVAPSSRGLARGMAAPVDAAADGHVIELGGGTGKMTVSMGVAALGTDGSTLTALLDAADERLYAAKEAGRNRVFGPE